MSYEINEIFAEMEFELIESYKRSVAKGTDRGFDSWQKQKLIDLKEYRQETRKIVNKYTAKAGRVSAKRIAESYGSKMDETFVLGLRQRPIDSDTFFKVNRRKVDALIDAVNNDYKKAGVAALRLTDDKYREIIFKSQMFLSSGTMTLNQAIDRAAQDFLHKGINCIEYANGNKVNIASYAEMALRTANKRAVLTGQGAMMAEQGEYLVQVSSYGACSDTCLPWQGKVYFDDVYAGGTPGKDNKYPLLSTAMAEGLYHPNCRHSQDPYIEGISNEPPKGFDEGKVRERYAAEQKQRAIERKIREWKRVQAGSTDTANQQQATLKVKEWQAVMREHINKHPYLDRKYQREKIYQETLKSKKPTFRSERMVREEGRAVFDKLKQKREPDRQEYLRVKKEVESTQYYAKARELKELETLRDKPGFVPQEMGLDNFSEVRRKLTDLGNEVEELKLTELYETGLEERFWQAQQSLRKSPTENAEDLAETIRDFREVGYTDRREVRDHLMGNTTNEASSVVGAYEYLPRDWVDASISHGTLEVISEQRGYYSHGRGTVAISGSSSDANFRCAVHELGHRMEKLNPDILRLEKEFYERRTAGESLEWLGDPYDKSEVTRFDKFLDPYMGKDYSGYAYELVSMGLEMAYTRPTELWKDKEFAEFIYGLLMTL